MARRHALKLALIFPLVIAASACNREPAHKQNAAAASGDVLPSTITDAMIPYETLKSQPPLATGNGATGVQPDDTRQHAKPASDRAKPRSSPGTAPTPAASVEPSGD